MASFSRSISYRRSFNRHQRAARDNTQLNSQKFHENIKDLKQCRRQVKKYMWEWMDPKSRERVDREFRNALTQICEISSNFEDILDLTSARTQRLLNEVEKGYQEDIKQIRRDNEGKLRRLQQSLEDSQSDNKKLSDHCEGYRRQIERLQQQIATQKDEETQYMQKHNELSEEIQKLKANLKESDEALSRLSVEQQRLSEEKRHLEQDLNKYDEKLTKSDIQQKSIEEENRNLRLELKKIEDNHVKSLSKLQEENNVLRTELSRRDETLALQLQEKENAIHAIEIQNTKLKKRESEILALQNGSVSELRGENNVLRTELSKRDETLALQLQEKENAIHAIEIQNTKLKKRESEILALQNGIRRFQEEEDNMRNTIDKLQQHLAAEKHAKEDALTRLSAAAANKLRDNNPGIADLSDPNRPMKLAEKLSELYDNEWTNAMEIMEDKGVKEEDGIQILLNILTNVFTLCKDGGNKVMSAIENFIAVPAIDGLDLSQVKIESLPKFQSEMLKPLKDYRKYNGEEVVPFIKEVIIEKLRETAEGKKDHVIEDCKEYIDKAIEYCWMMRVQDPPVHIEWDFSIGSNFDTNKFRSYTKGGHYVSFVVWPVLYLHENGPLLAKGVVQGKKTIEK